MKVNRRGAETQRREFQRKDSNIPCLPSASLRLCGEFSLFHLRVFPSPWLNDRSKWPVDRLERCLDRLEYPVDRSNTPVDQKK
jgi:hypothetical protein